MQEKSAKIYELYPKKAKNLRIVPFCYKKVTKNIHLIGKNMYQNKPFRWLYSCQWLLCLALRVYCFLERAIV